MESESISVQPVEPDMSLSEFLTACRGLGYPDEWSVKRRLGVKSLDGVNLRTAYYLLKRDWIRHHLEKRAGGRWP